MLTDDRSAHLSTAETNAIKALSLDPDRALAHRVLGTVYIITNRSAQGIAECEQALALDRNLADAHGVIGMAKYFMGRAAETEGHILEAFRLSPRDIYSHRWMHFVGMAKLQLGADAEAVGWFRRSIEANRNSPLTHFALAAALGLHGSLDDAQTAAKAGLVLSPGFSIRRLRASNPSNNPTFLSGRERVYVGIAPGRSARGMMSAPVTSLTSEFCRMSALRALRSCFAARARTNRCEQPRQNNPTGKSAKICPALGEKYSA